MTAARKRSRSSAKAAGARFERQIADYMAAAWDDRIDRKVKTGAADKGDIANLRALDGSKITVECKNESSVKLSGWWREATTERDNAGDDHAVVVSKRHGVSDPAEQWVHMTLAQLIDLLNTTQKG